MIIEEIIGAMLGEAAAQAIMWPFRHMGKRLGKIFAGFAFVAIFVGVAFLIVLAFTVAGKQ